MEGASSSSTSTRKMFVVVTAMLLLLIESNAFQHSIPTSSYNRRHMCGLTSRSIVRRKKAVELCMHMGHSHSHHHHDHDHGHSDDHDDQPAPAATGPYQSFSLWGQLMNPGQTFLRQKRGKVLLAALIVTIPALMRKRFNRIDMCAFAGIAAVLTVFDSIRYATKKWISKVKLFQESLVKHSTPLTRQYFFKNENAADRVTLLGVYINVVLSIVKFFGGLAFNSAVLVADAGHSLSDLFSDFITLYAVQVARLPPDEDHPYGHGKFESVGSLFLSLTLLATGLSVGAWSYEKMREVITIQQLAATVKGAATAVSAIKIPAWPALALAALSIASKEWLFQVTKRVGEALNSQILVANAWHHRSDAFSSILSLISIAVAIAIPGLLVADSAAGILVAGMICLTGLEILFESVKQLTDTSDSQLAKKIAVIARNVDGVLGAANIRARTVGSGSLVDLTVLTDVKISASAAHAIGEKARWKILESLPYVSDVLVHTRSTETVCPLLSRNQRDPVSVENDVRSVLKTYDEVREVKKVIVHYVNTAVLCTEILIRVDPTLRVGEVEALAKRIQTSIKKDTDMMQVEIQLDVSSGSTSEGSSSGLDILQENRLSTPAVKGSIL